MKKVLSSRDIVVLLYKMNNIVYECSLREKISKSQILQRFVH